MNFEEIKDAAIAEIELQIEEKRKTQEVIKNNSEAFVKAFLAQLDIEIGELNDRKEFVKDVTVDSSDRDLKMFSQFLTKVQQKNLDEIVEKINNPSLEEELDEELDR